MSTAFDPYHRWLGIRPEDQPADHYRLLGLSRFEDDPEVIRDAAERQMGHVRHYSLGPHRDLSQRILNELGAARACLLVPAKKARYDAKLRAAATGPSPPEPPSAETVAASEPAFVPVTPRIDPTKRATPGRSRVQPSRRKPETKTNRLQITGKHLLIGGIAAGVVVLVGTTLAFFFGGPRTGTEKGRVVATKGAKSSETPSGTKVAPNPASEKNTPTSQPDAPSGAEKPTEKSHPARPEGIKETTLPAVTDTKSEAKPESKSEPKPEPKPEPPDPPTPPALAAAPFDRAQAKRHQAAWGSIWACRSRPRTRSA